MNTEDIGYNLVYKDMRILDPVQVFVYLQEGINVSDQHSSIKKFLVYGQIFHFLHDVCVRISNI